MKKYMPLEGLRWSRDSGSALYDTPQTAVLGRAGGKALFIDCWATWCGPCCGEIPYMEKLHEHFKNSKDVELISISLDSNKKKWLQKLKEDKPKWRQFICPDNFKSQLCQNYDIDAIPRFLFFDKEGRIISLDAKRPSEQDIIRYIDENLK